MARYNLTRLPGLKTGLKSRWPQLVVQVVAAAGFTFAILTGLVGTPIGSHNFAIITVWIAWWALLILAIVPFFGRAWCSVCPIPLPGEWLQRGAVLAPNGKARGLGRRWPNALRGIWLQNGAFILLAVFSAVLLTQPRVTAVVLLALVAVAIGTSLVFERRAFCRYLCPVGGFIGLYSQLAPLELRVADTAVCAAHQEKTCYTGSAEGYGCPWQVFPGGLVKNTACGLCVECLRTCPHDNIVLNLRPAGADLAQARGRGLDEAFKALIMLGAALAYAAVMLGPWGGLKAAAYAVGSPLWWGYAGAFVGLVLILLPGLWLAAIVLGRALARSQVGVRQAFTGLAYALVPLGLAAWVAFSLAFVFASLSYLWPVISDPFGVGWDLLGTARLEWQPYAMAVVPWLQIVILAGGLAWASRTALGIASEHLPPRTARLQALPVIAYCLVASAGMLWLLVG
jgi:polyferredoxin